MASLEQRAGRFRIVFRFGGQKFHHALNTDNADDAEGCLVRLQENLRLLERGRLELPPGADLPVFLLSDGKLNAKLCVVKPLTLKEFFEHYKAQLPDGAKEANTRYIENIHLAHLSRILGSRTAMCAVSTATGPARSLPSPSNFSISDILRICELFAEDDVYAQKEAAECLADAEAA